MDSKCANTPISMTSLDQNISVILQIKYILEILEQFGTENYTWKLNVVQNFYELWKFFLSYFWVQNVLIPLSQKIPQGAKCANTLKLHTTFD